MDENGRSIPAESDEEHGATTLTRRGLLTGAALAAGAAISARAAKAVGAQAAPDPTKVPGARPQVVGSRSPHETPEKLISGSIGGVTRTPHHELHGILTPADLHFERHHHGIPQIDPASYRLLIHGMVDRPMLFTLDELKRFPQVSRLHFLECSGNGGAAYRVDPPTDISPQAMDGLLSTSEWSGVSLATLFEEVGAHPDATWFLAEGSDAAVMSRSIPMEKAWDDAMIAYGQNGEAIRPEQGYPARLLLPGWEGNASVKWVRRLELSDRPFMFRDETSRYTDPLPDGRARIFSFVMDAKSIITHPTYPTRLEDPGFVEISGYAWTGRGVIERVDVSIDGGATWEAAELQEPVLPKCTTRFRHAWEWDGEPAHLMSRAVDETGYVQPTAAQVRDVRGPGTRYHYNSIRGWRIAADGTIGFAAS
ncbi:MAG: sulfite dehydrogenase [Gemmatimonadetes bacterium]|nr:sulfite dehydrogenase [Gemmatimonadota bacterium]